VGSKHDARAGSDRITILRVAPELVTSAEGRNIERANEVSCVDLLNGLESTPDSVAVTELVESGVPAG
jgi:hypothetical protein